MADCMKCGRALTHDEVGLYRKIVHRDSKTFLCITCLSEKFALPERDLHDMIERFRRAGCTLFDRREVNK